MEKNTTGTYCHRLCWSGSGRSLTHRPLTTVWTGAKPTRAAKASRTVTTAAFFTATSRAITVPLSAPSLLVDAASNQSATAARSYKARRPFSLHPPRWYPAAPHRRSPSLLATPLHLRLHWPQAHLRAPCPQAVCSRAPHGRRHRRSRICPAPKDLNPRRRLKIPVQQL